jgi:hypothetical protein
MKELKWFLTVLAIIFLLNGACSSEQGINKSKFVVMNGTAHMISAAISSGKSYRQISDLVQQLSGEIAALKGRTKTTEEKDLLDAYSDLLEIYGEGLVLWKYKLEFAFFDPVLKGRIYVGQDVEPIVDKYRFSTESHLYKPTGQYWKSIAGDSIRIIWSNADSQLKIIEHLTSY